MSPFFLIKAKYRMIAQAAVVSPRCPLELGQVPTQQQHSRRSARLEHGQAGQKVLGGQADPKGERGSGPRRGSCRKSSFQETLEEDVFPATLCGAGRPVLGIMGKEELRGAWNSTSTTVPNRLCLPRALGNY